MKPKLYLICFFIAISLQTVNAQQTDIDRLYNTIDSLIEHRSELLAEKEIRLKALKDGLQEGLDEDQLFKLNERIYDEYMAYNFDSAYYYINKNVERQRALGHADRFAASAVRMAHILAVSGIFNNARLLLNEVRVEDISTANKIDYYEQQSELNLFRSEMANFTPLFPAYVDSMQHYRQKILEIAPHDSYNYIFNLATYTCEQGEVDKAIKMLEDYLPKLRQGDRHYSIVTSTLAFFYTHKDQPETREKYLLLSAISDLRASILENNSLRELSIILLERQEYKKAYNYLQQASADAKLYGSRLRSLQAARLAPLITKAYDTERVRTQNRTYILLAILSVITLLLIGTIAFILSMMRKRRAAIEKINTLNQELERRNAAIEAANNEMKESNRIKDEYIGRFLELSSNYIQRDEERAKLLNRLARDKKMAELYTELKSSSSLNESIRLFYQNFDTAFLNIYPNFIKEVNSLMANGNQFEVDGGQKLTTELRILALIRLGINDNQKIADILRSSITTIYTYRSKIKSRALSKDTFEDEIRIIATY
ncbi:MAG: hypothetical protein J6I38_12410 [Prevotella sp.]|nr:hypothetical protein [Prevotella sp.]